MPLDLLADFRKIRPDWEEDVTYFPLTGKKFGGYFGSPYFPKTYWPPSYFGNGGVGAPLPRPIKAILDRNPLVLGAGRVTENAIGVWVDNDATTGISSAEIDRGGDRIKLAVNIGQAQVERTINRIVRQTKGWLLLEVA